MIKGSLIEILVCKKNMQHAIVLREVGPSTYFALANLQASKESIEMSANLHSFQQGKKI